MELTDMGFTMKLTYKQLKALQKGLHELDRLHAKYPNERGGFDIPSQEAVDRIRRRIDACLDTSTGGR